MSKVKNTIHTLSEVIPPTILTIFGATGDLATLKLIPTLVHMDSEGLLPDTFRLVCVGRRPFTVTALLELVVKHAEDREHVKPAAIKKFARLVEYYQGDFSDPKSFEALTKVLEDRMVARKQGQAQDHICYNRLYYFATAPEHFAPIAEILKRQGLLVGCSEHGRTIRVLVEKPFGTDLTSAKILNKRLLKFFTEKQIYRIDHYLGKETVQNILIVRFANDFMEPVWRREYIDHIEISVLESLGGARGFYDKTGALRDFVQNHILQMLALVCMDRPNTLNAEDVRDAKLAILKSLKPLTRASVATHVVRAQYGPGRGSKGYTSELGSASRTETFVALQVELLHPRWRGVPIYLKTGKQLGKKLTEISVHFKKQNTVLFPPATRAGNVVVFRIQPDERVSIQVNNKIPGFGITLHTGTLDFGYKMNFKSEIPVAYERLLLDFIQGDQRLFIRSDEIEASWKFVDSITKNWTLRNVPLNSYIAGSTGPDAADRLIADHNRAWWTI